MVFSYSFESWFPVIVSSHGFQLQFSQECPSTSSSDAIKLMLKVKCGDTRLQGTEDGVQDDVLFGMLMYWSSVAPMLSMRQLRSHRNILFVKL
jgi:hypothetical protein